MSFDMNDRIRHQDSNAVIFLSAKFDYQSTTEPSSAS